jgi:hypothetical protein
MESLQGKIYAIKSNQVGDIYIGSTCDTLTKRLSCHKSSYKKYLIDGKKYVSAFEILKYSDAYIELIELYNCGSRKELTKREGEFMIKFNSINKCIGGRTRKEYEDLNRDKINATTKLWIEKNKEKINENRKKYKEVNKTRIVEYQKEYDKNRRLEKRDELNLKSKEYYEQNKKSISDAQKEYYKKNAEKLIQRNKEYRQRKKLERSLVPLAVEAVMVV